MLIHAQISTIMTVRSFNDKQFLNSIKMAVVLILSVTIAGACKKDNLNFAPPASVQLFNGMNDGVVLYTNLTGTHPVIYSGSMTLLNNSFTRRSNVLYVNNFPQAIDFYARPDTMPHNEPVLSTSLAIEAGAIYSLFIYGDKSTAACSMVEDHFPTGITDSVTYIRIANFSEGQTISVNLKGAATGSVAQNLAFKSLSEFIPIPLNSTVQELEFEVRDQVTGDIKATYLAEEVKKPASNPWLFRPVTFVFTGLPAAVGPNAQKLIPMLHLQN